MSEFDYVKMLEIPVNSCSVEVKPTKKRKKDVKKQVIDKVNLETVEEKNAPSTVEVLERKIKKSKKIKKDNNFLKSKRVKGKQINNDKEENSVQIKNSGFDIVSVQVVAIFVLIVGIILTNIFWEDSGINNLMRSAFKENPTVNDQVYSTFNANLPSKTGEVALENGVMTVDGGSVYSPCDGTIESVVENDGIYTVTVRHSESFSTVFSGIENVYATVNEKVYSNIPIGYSSKAFTVSMFDGDAILTSYALSENQIVWLG